MNVNRQEVMALLGKVKRAARRKDRELQAMGMTHKARRSSGGLRTEIAGLIALKNAGGLMSAKRLKALPAETEIADELAELISEIPDFDNAGDLPLYMIAVMGEAKARDLFRRLAEIYNKS